MGYDSINAIDNIGSFIYYLFLMLSFMILSQISYWFGSIFSIIRYGQFDIKWISLTNRAEKLLNYLTWNPILRLCIEASLDLFISALIRFKNVSLFISLLIIGNKWNYRFLIWHDYFYKPYGCSRNSNIDELCTNQFKIMQTKVRLKVNRIKVWFTLWRPWY